MSERLPRQRRIRIRQLGDSEYMVHPVDVVRHPRRGDIPVIILQRVQVDQRDRDVPVFADRRVGLALAPNV